MRRFLLATLTAAMLLGLSAPAFAHPTVPLGPTMPIDVTYAATDNVEHLGRFPEHWGTAGGRLGPDGDRYYVTDPRGVYVYDVTTPESPELLGSIDLYQQTTGVALAQEEPDTDGNILLVDGATAEVGTAQLHVVDVSDPEAMSVLSVVSVVDHTWTCVSATGADDEVNGCAYAYGRTGHIVDLTDPTDAKLLEHTWRIKVNFGDSGINPYTHDMTEIRPGLVFTAGITPILMDTSDPANPVELARITQPGRFSSLGYHSVEWANGGRDPFVVLGTEIAPPPLEGRGPENAAGSDCEGENSVIETWDATEILAAFDAVEEGADPAVAFADAEFHRIDTFDAGGRGIFLDGQAPGHILYCAHWMRLHPDFDAGGTMAVSYYNQGTRFVDIDADGFMTEIGWIVAADTYSGSPRWVTDEIVYVSDYTRGLEVIRLIPQVEASAVYTNSTDVIALTSTFGVSSPLGTANVPVLAAGFFLLLLLAGTELRARRRRAGGAAA